MATSNPKMDAPGPRCRCGLLATSHDEQMTATCAARYITECGAARYVGTDPNGYVWVAYGTQNFDDLCEKFDNPARQRRRAK